MGDFNAATSDNAMEDFCSLNDLESLISNQHNVFETGISDFHLLIVTQLKMVFQKKLPKIITYPSYKKTLTMLNFVMMLII